MLINSWIGDAEIESLFGIADKIWSCCSLESDKASGIFGRAMQWGVPVIVRADSSIHQFAQALNLACLPVVFGDCDAARSALLDRIAIRWSGPTHEQFVTQIASWRDHFRQSLLDALTGKQSYEAICGDKHEMAAKQYADKV